MNHYRPGIARVLVPKIKIQNLDLLRQTNERPSTRSIILENLTVLGRKIIYVV